MGNEDLLACSERTLPSPGNITERKKWNRNGSTVEPFSCPQDGPLLGTVLLSLCKVVSFSTKKRLKAVPVLKRELI